MEYILTYWKSPVESTNEPLPRDTQADVAIVGGGMAGLGTAYQLLKSDPSLSIWLLEAKDIGYGASGRNAGIIEAPLLNPLWMFSGSLPKPEALWALNCLHRLCDRELLEMKRIARHSELIESQTLIGATSRLALEALYHSHHRLADAGVPTRMINAGEIKDLCGSELHGAIDLKGYLVNPLALTRDLAAVVIAAGGHIACGERVTMITPGGREQYVLQLQSGSRIRVRKVVVCTGAWTRDLNAPGRPNVHPFATYMMASGPLDDIQLSELGSDSLCISEIFRSSYRRMHQRRLLFGGIGWPVKRPETAADFDARMLKKLKERFSASLPWLSGLSMTQSWGGPTSTTGRGVPVIAPAREHSGIIYNVGFQSFLPAILSGSMVKGLVLGKAHTDEEAERLRLAFAASRIPWVGVASTGIGLLGRALFRKRPV